MRETATSPFVSCDGGSVWYSLQKKILYSSIVEIARKMTLFLFNFSKTGLHTLDTLKSEVVLSWTGIKARNERHLYVYVKAFRRVEYQILLIAERHVLRISIRTLSSSYPFFKLCKYIALFFNYFRD